MLLHLALSTHSSSQPEPEPRPAPKDEPVAAVPAPTAPPPQPPAAPAARDVEDKLHPEDRFTVHRRYELNHPIEVRFFQSFYHSCRSATSRSKRTFCCLCRCVHTRFVLARWRRTRRPQSWTTFGRSRRASITAVASWMRQRSKHFSTATCVAALTSPTTVVGGPCRSTPQPPRGVVQRLKHFERLPKPR